MFTYTCAARIARSSEGCSSKSGRFLPKGEASKYSRTRSAARAPSRSTVNCVAFKLYRSSLCALMDRRRATPEDYEEFSTELGTF